MLRCRATLALGAVMITSIPSLTQRLDQYPPVRVKVRSLALISNDLSRADRQRIAAAFEKKRYIPEELSERIRQSLRDEGYYHAIVEEPKLAHIWGHGSNSSASFSFQVYAGTRYRLDHIQFKGNSPSIKDALIFPPNQLRAQFPIENGAVFNASTFGRGLEQMRELYLEKGYADFVAVPNPEIDETHRTIAVSVDVDKGRCYSFGRLFLHGVEPHAGDANKIFEAWRVIQGKTYSPKALGSWLAAHAPYWRNAEEAQEHFSLNSHPETQVIDVFLQFP